MLAISIEGLVSPRLLDLLSTRDADFDSLQGILCSACCFSSYILCFVHACDPPVLSSGGKRRPTMVPIC